MSAQTQRTNTLNANIEKEKLHLQCQVEIKKNGPHFGIYCVDPKCSKTGQWISWINKNNIQEIIKSPK